MAADEIVRYWRVPDDSLTDAQWIYSVAIHQGAMIIEKEEFERVDVESWVRRGMESDQVFPHWRVPEDSSIEPQHSGTVPLNLEDWSLDGDWEGVLGRPDRKEWLASGASGFEVRPDEAFVQVRASESGEARTLLCEAGSLERESFDPRSGRVMAVDRSVLRFDPVIVIETPWIELRQRLESDPEPEGRFVTLVNGRAVAVSRSRVRIASTMSEEPATFELPPAMPVQEEEELLRNLVRLKQVREEIGAAFVSLDNVIWESEKAGLLNWPDVRPLVETEARRLGDARAALRAELDLAEAYWEGWRDAKVGLREATDDSRQLAEDRSSEAERQFRTIERRAMQAFHDLADLSDHLPDEDLRTRWLAVREKRSGLDEKASERSGDFFYTKRLALARDALARLRFVMSLSKVLANESRMASESEDMAGLLERARRLVALSDEREALDVSLARLSSEWLNEPVQPGPYSTPEGLRRRILQEQRIGGRLSKQAISLICGKAIVPVLFEERSSVFGEPLLHDRLVKEAAITPDRHYLASYTTPPAYDDPSDLRFWDLRTGHCRSVVQKSHVWDMEAPRADTILVYSDRLELWDPESGARRAAVDYPGSRMAEDVSADGSCIGLLANDSSYGVWVGVVSLKDGGLLYESRMPSIWRNSHKIAMGPLGNDFVVVDGSGITRLGRVGAPSWFSRSVDLGGEEVRVVRFAQKGEVVIAVTPHNIHFLQVVSDGLIVRATRPLRHEAIGGVHVSATGDAVDVLVRPDERTYGVDRVRVALGGVAPWHGAVDETLEEVLRGAGLRFDDARGLVTE